MIRRHILYGKYVLKHKWYVMVECFRHKILWRGIVHDNSKFLPKEWFPYANTFYDKKGKVQYKPTRAFDYAWLHHQKVNKHHWQYWMLPEDDGGVKLLPIPKKYLKEMVCDWIGAGIALGFGRDNIIKWYKLNKQHIQLLPSQRRYVEFLIRRWV